LEGATSAAHRPQQIVGQRGGESEFAPFQAEPSEAPKHPEVDPETQTLHRSDKIQCERGVDTQPFGKAANHSPKYRSFGPEFAPQELIEWCPTIVAIAPDLG
jgi:hypothetical protein